MERCKARLTRKPSPAWQPTRSCATASAAKPASGTSTLLTVSSNSISGVRTFNGDGTGHVVFTVHTINYPAQLFGGVSFSTGGGSVSTLEANFTYLVNSDRTI